MTLIHAIFLGVLQGLTEWLPVSSSGHLVITQQFLGLRVPVAFDLMLHVGSLVAILALMWRDMTKILRAVLSFRFTSYESWFGLYLIAAMLATAAIGFAFKGFFESLFSNLLAVGFALVVNGFVLFSVRYAKVNKKTKKLRMLDALFIGAAQGLSLVPGLSRSGLTISTGLWRGVDRRTVVRFSFLLAFLAIAGASTVEIGLGGMAWEAVPIEMAIIGTIVSAIVSYTALHMVIKVLMTKRFHQFAYYCWILGIAIILLGPI